MGDDEEIAILINSTTHYDVLSVDRIAPPAVIRKAYLRASMKYHPDRNRHALAKEAFQKIGEAYSVLIDPQKRAM